MVKKLFEDLNDMDKLIHYRNALYNINYQIEVI